MIDKIITDLEKLSGRADEINVAKNGKLVQETNIQLKRIIRENNLTALSAPLIDKPYRLFCVKFNDAIKCFVNPMITKAEGLTLSREKCECFPNKEYIRPRNTKIMVMYSTPLGKIESVQLVGKAAIVFQHQVDHLDGLLLPDVGLEVDEDFDNGTDEEKEEIINMYLESLDIKKKTLDKEIENNEDLKKMRDSIDFMTDLQTGKISVEMVKEDSKIEEVKKESDNIDGEPSIKKNCKKPS